MTQSMLELRIPTTVFGATVVIEGELPTFRDGGVVYPRWEYGIVGPGEHSEWGAGGARDARFLVYIGPSNQDFDSITDVMMTEVSTADVSYTGPTDLGIPEIAHPPFDYGFAHPAILPGITDLTLTNFRINSTSSYLQVDWATSTGLASDKYVRLFNGNLRFWSTFFAPTDSLTNGIYGSFNDIVGPLAPGASGSLDLNVGTGLYGTPPNSLEIYEYYLVLLARQRFTEIIVSPFETVGSSYDGATRNAFRLKDAIPATPASPQSLYIKYAPTSIPADAPRGIALYNITVEAPDLILTDAGHTGRAHFSAIRKS